MKDIHGPPIRESKKQYIHCKQCGNVMNYSFFQKFIGKSDMCKCKQDYNHIDYVNHNPPPTGPRPPTPKGPPPPPQYSSHETKKSEKVYCHRFMKYYKTFEESKKSEVACSDFLDLLSVMKGIYMDDHGVTPFSNDIVCDIIKLTNIETPVTYSLVLFNGKPFGYTYFG